MQSSYNLQKDTVHSVNGAQLKIEATGLHTMEFLNGFLIGYYD